MTTVSKKTSKVSRKVESWKYTAKKLDWDGKEVQEVSSIIELPADPGVHNTERAMVEAYRHAAYCLLPRHKEGIRIVELKALFVRDFS